MANIFFLRRKFFIIKMEEDDDMLAHINKVKALADELNGADVAINNGDIVVTLLESLPSSYEYLMIAMERSPIQELTLDYLTSRLLYELSRRKENESRGETSALLAKQSRGGASRSSTEKVCFYCGKKGHIAKYCFKRKNNEKESANNTKVHDRGDEYAFMTSHECSEEYLIDGVDEYAMMASNVSCNASVSDWIVDSGATSHIAPERTCFQSYILISPRMSSWEMTPCFKQSVGIPWS